MSARLPPAPVTGGACRATRPQARGPAGSPRISPDGWPTPDPESPSVAASRISPIPVLIVHGDKDLFFPPDHGRELYEGAREPKELWLVPGFGHAERAADDSLIDRIATWVADAVSRRGAAPEAATAG